MRDPVKGHSCTPGLAAASQHMARTATASRLLSCGNDVGVEVEALPAGK